MKAATEQDYHERIVRALVYIQENLDDDPGWEQAASVAAFSPFHFHRIFRALVGETVSDYVRRLRLERAARNLKQSGEPVTQIALDAGFAAHESFTRAFGNMFGTSPSNYRAGNQPPVYEELTGVEVRDLAPMRVVFLRHVGPYGEVGGTWGRLMAWAGQRGLLGPGAMMIGIVHDDPDVTPGGKIRYDAAVTVSRPVEAQGEFGVMELKGGRYAIATHRGPYDELGKVYQRLYGSWLPKSGYTPADAPGFEHYVNSPYDTKAEDLVTRIHVPVL